MFIYNQTAYDSLQYLKEEIVIQKQKNLLKLVSKYEKVIPKPSTLFDEILETALKDVKNGNIVRKEIVYKLSNIAKVKYHHQNDLFKKDNFIFQLTEHLTFSNKSVKLSPAIDALQKFILKQKDYELRAGLSLLIFPALFEYLYSTLEPFDPKINFPDFETFKTFRNAIAHGHVEINNDKLTFYESKFDKVLRKWFETGRFHVRELRIFEADCYWMLVYYHSANFVMFITFLEQRLLQLHGLIGDKPIVYDYKIFDPFNSMTLIPFDEMVNFNSLFGSYL